MRDHSAFVRESHLSSLRTTVDVAIDHESSIEIILGEILEQMVIGQQVGSLLGGGGVRETRGVK